MTTGQQEPLVAPIPNPQLTQGKVPEWAENDAGNTDKLPSTPLIKQPARHKLVHGSTEWTDQRKADQLGRDLSLG